MFIPQAIDSCAWPEIKSSLLMLKLHVGMYRFNQVDFSIFHFSFVFLGETILTPLNFHSNCNYVSSQFIPKLPNPFRLSLNPLSLGFSINFDSKRKMWLTHDVKCRLYPIWDVWNYNYVLILKIYISQHAFTHICSFSRDLHTWTPTTSRGSPIGRSN
jgi:hypothetical protein